MSGGAQWSALLLLKRTAQAAMKYEVSAALFYLFHAAFPHQSLTARIDGYSSVRELQQSPPKILARVV